MPRYPTNPDKGAKKLFEEIQEHGKVLSPMHKRLFTRGNMLSDKQREVRDEMIYLLWTMLGKDATMVRTTTGASDALVNRVIKARIKQKEEIATLVHEHEVELEETRFKGRKALIDLCFEGATRAMERGIDQIPKMKGREAIVAAGVMVDKGLLLSGQPTSRVAKTDERMMDNEELKVKADELRKRMGKLKIVDVGEKDKKHSAG